MCVSYSTFTKLHKLVTDHEDFALVVDTEKGDFYYYNPTGTGGGMINYLGEITIMLQR